jgi:hypothetical protein
MFTVKELHNTHRSNFQQHTVKAILILPIKNLSLCKLNLNFVLEWLKVIAAKFDLSHIAPDIIYSEGRFNRKT